MQREIRREEVFHRIIRYELKGRTEFSIILSGRQMRYIDYSYEFSDVFRKQFEELFDNKFTHIIMATDTQALLMSEYCHYKNIRETETTLQE